MTVAILLLSTIGPVLLASITIALALLWNGGGPIGAVPLLNLAALVALWPTVTGASVAILCRWICPGAWGRAAALAAALWGLLSMISSPSALAALVTVSRDISAGRPMPVDALALLKELSLIGALSALVVMSSVLVFEVPLRIVVSRRSATLEDGLSRSIRGALTAVIILLGWVAIEDAAVSRLEMVLRMLRG